MTKYEWEPAYGFMETDKVKLAASLENLRRRVCAYRSVGDMLCDCKYGYDQPITGDWRYGLHPEDKYMSSEMTGCPELRSMIRMLLHGDEENPPGRERNHHS